MKSPNVTIRFWLGLPVAVSAGIEPGTTRAEAVVADGAPAWPDTCGRRGRAAAAARVALPSERPRLAPTRAAATSDFATLSPKSMRAAVAAYSGDGPSTAEKLQRFDRFGPTPTRTARRLRNSGAHTYKVCAAAFTSPFDQVTVRFSAGAAISRATRPGRDSRAHDGRRHHRRIWMAHRGKK
jgi:hypothetical protein